MHDSVTRSASAALLWDIWLRHRTLVCLLAAVTVFTVVLNIALPESYRMGAGDRATFDATDAVDILNMHLMLAAFLLVLAVCGYTEFDAQKSSSGFPRRLFTLPLTTFRLVALPMFLSIVILEVLGAMWRALVFRDSVNVWGTVLIAAYVVVHQTVLWTLPRLGSLRAVVLGVLGIVFIVAMGLPTFPQETLPWWLRVNFLTLWLVIVAVAGFLASWVCVAQQRSGGRSRRNNWASAIPEGLFAVLPQRTAAFSSPAAAHFWFEWRRSGFMLPMLVAALLVLVFGPVSWGMRDDGNDTMRILLAVMAMPIVLAFPVGKAVSKPDWRANDMGLPSFVAVRPLATADLVVTKMKVAAASAAVSWLLVCGFVAVWFGLWASWDGLNLVRVLLWSLYGRSVYPQYGLAVLALAAGMLVTWRFLVASLWCGLSGNRKLFAGTALAYSVGLVLLLVFATISSRVDESIREWIFNGFGNVLPVLVRIGAIAVIAKFLLAAWFWRKTERRFVRQYLAVWLAGTLALIAFALLFWAGVRYLVPADSRQLRSLFIFGAILALPFARIGLAPAALARNRHRL
jgi:hypothetical protein